MTPQKLFDLVGDAVWIHRGAGWYFMLWRNGKWYDAAYFSDALLAMNNLPEPHPFHVLLSDSSPDVAAKALMAPWIDLRKFGEKDHGPSEERPKSAG